MYFWESSRSGWLHASTPPGQGAIYLVTPKIVARHEYMQIYPVLPWPAVYGIRGGGGRSEG